MSEGVLVRSSLEYLESTAGRELLEAAARTPGELLARVTWLRKRWRPEHVSAAIELLQLRDRAAVKFSRAPEMFFTRAGLEQSSAEEVARWRAARFPAGGHILDLCSGIGGDAMALSGVGSVTAVDRDPAASWCTRENAWVYGQSVSAACADVTRLRLKADAAFWDPSRRDGQRRVRSGRDYSPDLGFFREILRSVPDLAIKVSPAIPDSELDEMTGAGGRVEFISHRGECKEAVIWFGSIGPVSRRSASLVPTGGTLSADPSAPNPAVGPLGNWLVEPDPAVIRAHLLPELCALLGAWPLDAESAYLSANSIDASPFVRRYRILEWMPFSTKALKSRLRKMGKKITVVKRRAVPLEPEEMLRRLAVTHGDPVTLILGRVAGKITAILCDMPTHEERGRLDPGC